MSAQGKGHGEKLTRKQEAAIAALLSEPTQGEAARAVHVTDRTLRRWIKLPTFRKALQHARRDLLAGAVDRLQQACTEAVETLRRNLSCGNAGVETRAARTILELALRAKEMGDLEERIESLERLAEAQRAHR